MNETKIKLKYPREVEAVIEKWNYEVGDLISLEKPLLFVKEDESCLPPAPLRLPVSHAIPPAPPSFGDDESDMLPDEVQRGEFQELDNQKTYRIQEILRKPGDEVSPGMPVAIVTYDSSESRIAKLLQEKNQLLKSAESKFTGKWEEASRDQKAKQAFLESSQQACERELERLKSLSQEVSRIDLSFNKIFDVRIERSISQCQGISEQIKNQIRVARVKDREKKAYWESRIKSESREQTQQNLIKGWIIGATIITPIIGGMAGCNGAEILVLVFAGFAGSVLALIPILVIAEFMGW